MADVIQYKLSDRPKWWLPRIFKWASIISAGIAVFSFITSALLYATIGAIYELEEGTEDKENVALNVGDFFYDAAVASLDFLFAAVFLWLMAIAADKLDQLVWLNANDEDRSEIIQNRKRKKKS